MGRYDNTSNIIYKDQNIKARWAKYSWLVKKPDDMFINSVKITSQYAGEPRRIASAVYGDHNLYWVIVAFNHVWYADRGATNVFHWPIAGQMIYYPDFSVISPTIN